jgi:small subunit ribosomal protein S1
MKSFGVFFVMSLKKKDIIKQYEISPNELEEQVALALADFPEIEMAEQYEESIKEFEPEKIVSGRVISIANDNVIVDIGCKSEGEVPLSEFDVPPVAGEKIEVFLETMEDEHGEIILSKKKADRIRGWEQLITTKKEGDVVEGKVVRKIKGGLLLDVGVPVFLPASQIDIRRTGDISDYIGQDLKAQIIKIDEARMNIVVSRRRLIEEDRKRMKERLLEELEEGQLVTGVVKNIADFGVFVDLGGIDGLLHITDMSWGRISHPQEMVNIDDKIEVKILKLDRKRERIALGLKQKTESPWKNVEERYPVDSKIRGKVVNVMTYGAFVKLEEGIEGLVHISEMSWTKRISHPSEMVNIGDEVEVVVLEINKDKQEISLGMKQVDVNPWSLVTEKYPVGSVVQGKVRNMTSYGAFIELEEGIDGLLHISDMSWTKKIGHPSEMLKKNDVVEAKVMEVDPNQKRIGLSMKQLMEDPWEKVIPERYLVDDVVSGKVTKLTKFGVFVELEDSLEGLLHISELTDRKVKNPDEVIAVGDTVEVKILRVDQKERKIGLSLVKARSTEESEESQDEKAPADENTEAPADENTEAPADENTEAPADENTEAPADENTETPDKA